MSNILYTCEEGFRCQGCTLPHGHYPAPPFDDWRMAMRHVDQHLFRGESVMVEARTAHTLRLPYTITPDYLHAPDRLGGRPLTG